MRLRVATFNLENFDEPRRGGVSLDERIAVLRPQLIALRADVLCLQEVSAHGRSGGLHPLRALDRLLEGTPYAAFARATSHVASGGPADVHNLVVLSRLPIVSQQQHAHDLVEPPIVRLTTTPQPRDEHVRWDRPVLEVRLELPDGRPLVVFDVHLRAPLAANIEGQKLAPQVWRTSGGWAEGYLLAAIKRVGQALELRRHIDRIFDDDGDARILVAGDLNAGVTDSAFRILRADIEDTGNPALAGRSLVPLEERVAESRRYTVVHRGRPLMLDHLLASASLASCYVDGTIFNEGLPDEYELGVAGIDPVGSLHAPLVAELELSG
ncbi:MAG TPA: endonuclease/exonuclease/phosphatase family protein [Kofleriaceae bacterium]|nr:endonuclease/exonuclease/phosphatase family protein [Kofleriaceae bacterium]